MNEAEGPRDLFAAGATEGLSFLEPLDPLHEDQRDLVEALIFASPEPIATDRLAELLEWEKERVLDLIERLNDDYEEQGRSFELLQLGGGWQLVSRRRYGGLLRGLLKEMVKPRLSRAALESLAVIAYRQPVTKGEIEAVRGVKADGVIRTLLERDLVQITGRADTIGRPLLYRTTRAFLETFGLDDLKGLPRRKEVDEWLKGLKEASQEELPPEQLEERRPQPEASTDELPLASGDPGESSAGNPEPADDSNAADHEAEDRNDEATDSQEPRNV